MGALVEGLRSRVLVVVAMILVELLGGATFPTGQREYGGNWGQWEAENVENRRFLVHDLGTRIHKSSEGQNVGGKEGGFISLSLLMTGHGRLGKRTS